MSKSDVVPVIVNGIVQGIKDAAAQGPSVSTKLVNCRVRHLNHFRGRGPHDVTHTSNADWLSLTHHQVM